MNIENEEQCNSKADKIVDISTIVAFIIIPFVFFWGCIIHEEIQILSILFILSLLLMIIIIAVIFSYIQYKIYHYKKFRKFVLKNNEFIICKYIYNICLFLTNFFFEVTLICFVVKPENVEYIIFMILILISYLIFSKLLKINMYMRYEINLKYIDNGVLKYNIVIGFYLLIFLICTKLILYLTESTSFVLPCIFSFCAIMILLFYIFNWFSIIFKPIGNNDIFLLHIDFKEKENIKEFIISEEYNKYNFYLPKNSKFSVHTDYLMLVLKKGNKIVSKNVKCIRKTSNLESENLDVILLDTNDVNYYSDIILQVENDGKIYNYKVKITFKQIFSINVVQNYRKYSKCNISKCSECSNVELDYIMMATFKYLVIYSSERGVQLSNDINYVTANYGEGKTTLTNFFKKNDQKIYRFSLLSSNFNTSFFEKLYFSIKYDDKKGYFSKNYIMVSSFVFFGFIFLAFLLTILNNIYNLYFLSDDKQNYILFIKSINNIDNIFGDIPGLFILINIVISISILIAIYIKDFVLSLNITNEYIKEDTYVKKILNYINKQNILLVIEDHDRIFDKESVKLNNSSFTKLYETKRNIGNNSKIIVTGMKLSRYTELVRENNEHYYIADDFYSKIFNILYDESRQRTGVRNINLKEKEIYINHIEYIITEYNKNINNKKDDGTDILCIYISNNYSMRYLKELTNSILEGIRGDKKIKLEYNNMENSQIKNETTDEIVIKNVNIKRKKFILSLFTNFS